ncbi:cytochrome c oxidase subunit 3 family protein [uncultured Cocleimonas sp.]|uniref:cytochrome c oxidase subunit 3 family protein n=1 Tax=uncultured Cocleimonas sp. TaxID=1051587 RepID=UPI00260FE305|nr:cytochrome c oxidase subunit 3 family protein [uncultured Cocleimonas sp.]
MNTDIIDQEPKLLPGDLAIWFFIFMELLVFGIAFISYAVVRVQNEEMFNQFQLTLNTELGAINTIVLITSSYFVVRAVHTIKKHGDYIGCSRWLYAAVAGGGLFLVLKSFEYYDKFSAGISLSTNTFYMFYLSLTMFHFLHVILGMIILLAIAIKAQRGGYSASNHIGVESGASYWHMVDLVWIILFPLVYVMR